MKKVLGQTVRDLKREVNKKVLKVPGIEQKILDATNNESWGPHGSHLADIAQATHNYYEYQLIMTVIWKRINDTGKNWRHVYKGLIVLEYLVVNGSEHVIDEIKQHARQILDLSDFQYIDSSGKDRGFNVRKKSESLVALISNKEKIQEVRGKASINREKFHGKVEDPDGNGKERARFHLGNFGVASNNIESGNENHQFGKKASNSDIVKGHSIDADDDGYLERKFSEGNISAPPSYEEATKGAQIDIHKESDASTLTSSPAQEALPCETNRTSSAESANHEASIKPDPCGSDPAIQHTASSTEVDLFGSFTDDPMNSSSPTPMMSTNGESEFTSILAFDDNSAIPSSSLSAVNMPSEDPFGGSPFKALSQEDNISQPQKETSLSSTQFSFGSVSFPEPVPSSGTTATVENDSGIAYGKTSNGRVGSFCQALPAAQTDNVLGDLSSQIGPTATFSEATPTVTPAKSQTPPSKLLMQTPLSNPTNPFVQSDVQSKEAPPNPFIQPSLSSQEILPNPFAETRLPLQASPNPFAESGPSKQDVSPNPFAESGVSTQDHKSNITESTSSVSTANNTSHLVVSSNGLPLSSTSQSMLPSSKSATDHVDLGLLASAASQSKLGLSSSKSDSSFVETDLPTVVTYQGSSPNYMTQSNLSSQTIPNLTQPRLSAPAVSQGLPPNYTMQPGLLSQTTTNSYSELSASAMQGLSYEHITQSPQTTSNLTQSGLTAPLVVQDLAPGHVVARPSLSPLVTSSPIQSEISGPLSAEGISHSYIAQPVVSSQTTHTQTSSSTISTCFPPSPVTKGFPSNYVGQSGSTASSTVQAVSSTTTVLPAKTIQPKEKFEPKSTVWADTLSRGLVNLDISGVKTNPLADIGVDFDSINRKEKMKEDKKTSTSVSTITMGKAMGSGSGLGRAAATGLAPSPNPMMSPGMGMSNFGGMGCYGGGMNQQMGMGMNMSMGMGQGVARQPGFGMPPGSSMAPHPGMPYIGNNQTMEMNGHGFQRPYSGGYS